jgi:hypothetical protein
VSRVRLARASETVWRGRPQQSALSPLFKPPRTTSHWHHLRRALSSLTDAPLPDGNEPRPATFDRAGLFCREGDT